jgi:ParB family chromosome partitioning protein
MNLSDQTNIAAEGNERAASDVYIPFDKLYVSPRNARTLPHNKANIECRAASIKAYGLLNALQVVYEPQEASGLEYGVIAGGGRYLSIEMLVATGAVPKDYPVKCVLRSIEEATAISLVENADRADLHEADEFVAFKRMVDEGKSVDTIAEHFGIPVRTVQQRLRLADLHPALIEEYRHGKIGREEVRAFCVTSDKERQLQVWNTLPQWSRTAWYIRSHLSRDSIDIKDALVTFVGLDTYREAGGHVAVDLFSATEGDGRIEDVALLHQLAFEKLNAIATDIVEKEGWLWFDVTESLDHTVLRQFERATTEQRALTDAEQAEVTRLSDLSDELNGKLDALQAELDGTSDEEGEDEDAAQDDDRDDEIYNQIEALEREAARVSGQLAEIERSRAVYSDEVRAQGGVIVALDGVGGFKAVRGLIRRVESETEAQPVATPTAAVSETPAKKARAELSERLSLQLSAHRTAVMQASMINRPKVAMAAIVRRLLSLVADRHRYGVEDVVKVTGTASMYTLQKNAPDLKGARASDEVSARIEAWRELIPAEAKDELPWLLSLADNELQELFALCVALTLDASTAVAGQRPGDDLGAALQINVADYWTATEVSYLGSVPKDKLMAAVDEACGTGSSNGMEKMKKGDAVKYAEQKLAGTGWLPAMLRSSISE